MQYFANEKAGMAGQILVNDEGVCTMQASKTEPDSEDGAWPKTSQYTAAKATVCGSSARPKILRREAKKPMSRRDFVWLGGTAFGFLAIGGILTGVLTGCDSSSSRAGESMASSASSAAASAASSFIDPSKWNYDSDSDVYWQAGISYCSNPANPDLETMGIYVPGSFMDVKDNGDGTFTCSVGSGKVGEYSAADAPYVIPVNTPGYSSMKPPSGMSSEAATYCKKGFVYLQAGCRGRESGAPAGVTDLKAAIRAMRASKADLPGNTDYVFSFGHSGGGAQSAILGASGDCALYDPYLKEIGAVTDQSDALYGAMCWCPITSLDAADEAYEWNMGLTRTDLDEDEQALSQALAEAFADQIEAMGLVDEEGNALSLAQSENGYYQSGSYYDYVLSQVEKSLEDFLAVTEFPYTSGGDGMGAGFSRGMVGFEEFEGDVVDGEQAGNGAMGGGAKGGGLPDGELPDGDLPDGELPDGDLPDGGFSGGGFPGGADASAGMQNGEKGAKGIRSRNGIDAGTNVEDDASGIPADADTNGEGDAFGDGILRKDNGSSAEAQTYATVEDYIAALNGDSPWITYDASTGDVKIASIEAFANACKKASKSVGAFDDLNRQQGENVLFGYGDGEGAHFDSIMAGILAGTEYEEAFAADLAKSDALGSSVQTRMNMYNPMYYLLGSSDGAGTSDVAPFWRIRTGIEQGDTAVTTEINLALALEADGKDVDFEMVWGQGHTQAELEGTASDNFAAWVDDCMK